jgi:hypothetical protein
MKIHLKAALAGVSLALLLSLSSLFSNTVYHFFFRNTIPHLFNFGAFVWSSTNGLIAPLTVAFIVDLLLIFLPLSVIGLVSGVLIKRKHRNWAIVVSVAALAAWLWAFYMLGQPMTMSHH